MGRITKKEIKEQYLSWDAVTKDMKNRDVGDFKFLDSTELVFVGCGTSYYLSLCGEAVYAVITGEPAKAVTASDVFLYPNALFSKRRNYVSVPISRSGETSETLWAARYLRDEMKIPGIALSCNRGSQLVKSTVRSLIAENASEESVVMTKSFTSMLLIIQWLAALRAGNESFMRELESLPQHGLRLIDSFEAVAKEISKNEDLKHFIFLGQGPYYGLACEATLKMKEMSLSSAEAYHSMEFRHGPISILNENSLVVFLMSETSKKEEIKLLKEVKEFGAKALVICDYCTPDIRAFAEYHVVLHSNLSDFARLNLYMPILQLLGLHKARQLGINPDNPRYLSQVVVLE